MRRLSMADETGGVLVFFVFFIPVAIILLSFAVDTANWFVHKRHLQTQADAAALAGAGAFTAPCVPLSVENAVKAYAGDEHNAQIARAQDAVVPPSGWNIAEPTWREGRVAMKLNKKSYMAQPTPTDDTVESDPCSTSTIDVKMTEGDLPWFFGLVDHINAHARVKIQQADSATGMLPIGVPDVDPKKVTATIVDESKPVDDHDRTVAVVPLQQAGKGACPDTSTMSMWCNEVLVPLKVDRSRLGVRYALSGSESTTCGQPQVECYDAGGSDGLVHIRGWSPSPSVGADEAPAVRGVRLGGAACAPNNYFSFPVGTTDCNVSVHAQVDLPPGVSAAQLSLNATITGTNQLKKLTYDNKGTADKSDDVWSSTLSLPVKATGGPHDVSIAWEQTAAKIGTSDCTTKPLPTACKGTWSNVHRAFGAVSERSGPIRLADVIDAAGAEQNSLRRCTAAELADATPDADQCTYSVRLRLGLQPQLRAHNPATVPIPAPVVMRLSGTGSQTQALDCDPKTPLLDDEIAKGCAPWYTENKGTQVCDMGAAALWSTPNPPAWKCVANDTGQHPNKIADGLNRRILGSSKPTVCNHPNLWGRQPLDFGADPRFVKVFLTPFGSFSGSGSGTVPVQRFAAFYVTGWSGSGGGFTNPCNGYLPYPDDVPSGMGKDGYIVGHFVWYLEPSNEGVSGTGPCDFSKLGTCVATMTD